MGMGSVVGVYNLVREIKRGRGVYIIKMKIRNRCPNKMFLKEKNLRKWGERDCGAQSFVKIRGVYSSARASCDTPCGILD